jgi:hypothetical protein
MEIAKSGQVNTNPLVRVISRNDFHQSHFNISSHIAIAVPLQNSRLILFTFMREIYQRREIQTKSLQNRQCCCSPAFDFGQCEIGCREKVLPAGDIASWDSDKLGRCIDDCLRSITQSWASTDNKTSLHPHHICPSNGQSQSRTY